MLLHDRPLPTLIPVCSGSRKEIVQLISIPWFVIRLHAHVAGKGDGGKGWCCLPAKGKASPPVVGGPVQSLSLSFFALFPPFEPAPPIWVPPAACERLNRGWEHRNKLFRLACMCLMWFVFDKLSKRKCACVCGGVFWGRCCRAVGKEGFISRDQDLALKVWAFAVCFKRRGTLLVALADIKFNGV